jgi:hypothetical protein
LTELIGFFIITLDMGCLGTYNESRFTGKSEKKVRTIPERKGSAVEPPQAQDVLGPQVAIAGFRRTHGDRA